MTPAELISCKDGAYVIDVREKDEQSDILPFAKSFPLSIFQSALNLSTLEFKTKFGFDKFKTTDKIILICFSGARSGHVSNFLRSKGFDAHNLDGGMLALSNNV